MQRIVRRTDLQSDDSIASDASDPETEGKLYDVQQFEYIAQPTNQGVGDPVEVGEAEEDLAFNLFAPTRTTTTGAVETNAPQKIRLRSPSAETTEPGFLGTGRRRSYYFVDSSSKHTQDDFATSAISGQKILTRSHLPWPGSHYDWKVLEIPSSQQSRDVVASAPLLFQKLIGTPPSAKRTRPGKKYRIKLRTKRAALLSKQEAAKVAAEAKEAADREKKTRKNREKKAKKRARDKAKAVAFSGDADMSQDDADESTDGT